MTYKRPQRPLRGGEFPAVTHRSDSRNWSRAFSRYEFFRLIDEEEPGVRELLLKTVYPLLPDALDAAPLEFLTIDDQLLAPEEEMSIEEQVLSLRLWSIREDSDLLHWYSDARESDHAGCKALHSAISDWAWDFNLFEPWIGDVALRTMLGWQYGFDQEGRWLTYWPNFPSALSEQEQHFRLDLPEAWDPTVISEKEARNQIRGVFAHRLQRFLDRGIELALKRGYERATADPREPERHLRWLVRFQVVGETFTAIGKSLDTEHLKDKGRKTVANGVKSAARAISIELRARDLGAAKLARSLSD